MKVIERIEPKRNKCRHCCGNTSKFKGLWATFFEEVDIGDISRISIFDHLSVNKYWLITQPYYVFDETGKIYGEKEEAITNALKYGVDCAIVKVGYHHKSTSTIIFYPFDANKFKEFVNSRLDKHTKYDSNVRTIMGDEWFDLSYVRRLIRNYQIPEKAEIIKSALDFLIWEVKK